jgi:hypothetical protein
MDTKKQGNKKRTVDSRIYMVKPVRMSYGKRLFIILPVTFVVTVPKVLVAWKGEVCWKWKAGVMLLCTIRFFRIRIAMINVISECWSTSIYDQLSHSENEDVNNNRRRLLCLTGQVSSRGNGSYLYSGDGRFESRPGFRLSWGGVLWFSSVVQVSNSLFANLPILRCIVSSEINKP